MAGTIRHAYLRTDLLDYLGMLTLTLQLAANGAREGIAPDFLAGHTDAIAVFTRAIGVDPKTGIIITPSTRNTYLPSDIKKYVKMAGSAAFQAWDHANCHPSTPYREGYHHALNCILEFLD